MKKTKRRDDKTRDDKTRDDEDEDDAITYSFQKLAGLQDRYQEERALVANANKDQTDNS